MPIITPATGTYIIGSGITETYNVTGTEVFDEQNATAAEPFLVVGYNGGDGGVLLSGAGDILTVLGEGDDNNAVFVAIGTDRYGGNIGAGSIGFVDVANGAQFIIEDTSDTLTSFDPVDDFYYGAEFMQIGRGTGSLGVLTIDAATFRYTGGAPELQVGHDGEGRIEVLNGSSFTMENAVTNFSSDPDAPKIFTTMQVGRANGAGTFIIEESSGVIDGTGGHGAGVTVGTRAGTGSGTFSLLDHADFTITGGSDNAFFDIGHRQGRGIVNVLDGSTLTLNGGSAFTGISVGLRGGNGTLNVEDSDIDILATTAGTGGSAYMDIGSGNEGGDQALGRVFVKSGGDIELRGTDNTQDDDFGTSASVQVGQDGARGELYIEEGGLLTIFSQDFAGLNVGVDFGGGMNGGDGFVLMDGGELVLESDNVEGTDDDVDGIADGDGQHGAYAMIGGRGGHGDVTMRNGATWTIKSNNGSGLNIGTDGAAEPADAGTGTLLVSDGSQINFEGNNHGPDGDDQRDVSIFVGGDVGSDGRLIVRSGGSIDMDIGDEHSAASFKIGAKGGGNGYVLIDGDNSRIINIDSLNIGNNENDVNAEPGSGGKGTLIVRNGGLLEAEDGVNIGERGTIGGGDATIAADMYLNSGGRIDLRDGRYAELSILGNLNIGIGANILNFDVGRDFDDNLLTDTLDLSGEIFVDGEINIIANVIDAGLQAGDEVAFVHADNDVHLDDDAVIDARVVGADADFGYYVGFLDGDDQNINLRALTDSIGTAVAELEFGTGAPAVLIYNATLERGTLTGGVFGDKGGVVGNIDEVRGTNGNDTLQISGGTLGRSFTLVGLMGNDTLAGGIGADDMDGGGNNDTYIVNNVNDIVRETGGSGTDTVQSSVTYNLANAARVFGTVEHLTLTGTTAINGTGSAGLNTLTGNNNVNTLDGGGSNDVLKGMGGNDILIGGLGKDTLNGGANNDTFKFTLKTHSTASATTCDLIEDFGDFGADKIDVSLLAGPKLSYIHNAAFTKAGQVRINDIAGADVIVEINLTGTSGVDFAIRLKSTSLASMSLTDFVL